MNQLWCNGRWLDADRYPAVADDRGAFLGLGLFETMGAQDGRPLFIERHLARLKKSCGRIGWLLEIPDISSIATELLIRNGLGEGPARLRLIVTGGSGPHNDLRQGKDHSVWLSASRSAQPPTSISLCLSPWPRNERSPLAGMKTACYAENLFALDHARRLGFDETLFLNTAGEVCETATANCFIVKNGGIVTPPDTSGCLPGIGREVLCEIALADGIACEMKTLRVSDVEDADEIFISSSTRGPVPVTKFEERIIEAGPLTRRLRDLWLVERAG